MATSVVDCLSTMDHGCLELSLLLSSSVAANLRELGTDLTVFKSCHTQNFFGLNALWQGMGRRFADFDLEFTVFGPAYFARRNTRHLFGFAQPNIAYPDNPQYERFGILQRWFTRAKYELQSLFFARADELVVELENVKVALQTRRLFKRKPIHVVYSSVHTVFNYRKRWVPLPLELQPGRLRLGVISRNYPHKNLSILADVKQHLLQEYGRDVDMFVTFTPEEWDACDQHFRKSIVNVGGLSLSQCPTFYDAMDGVVFPSLLECFSAVPIESMKMGRPLFASNLPFIRDVCGNHCQYFEPLKAADIARVIDAFFRQTQTLQQRICDEARTHAQRYPGPHERAEKYLALIRYAVTQKKSKFDAGV